MPALTHPTSMPPTHQFGSGYGMNAVELGARKNRAPAGGGAKSSVITTSEIYGTHVRSVIRTDAVQRSIAPTGAVMQAGGKAEHAK